MGATRYDDHGSSVIGFIYQLEQLESIAAFFFAKSQLATDEETTIEESELWGKLAATQAYRYCQNVEAWEAFCAEQGIESDDLLASVPGLWLTQIVNDHMRTISPTCEQIAEMFHVDPQRILTVSRLRESWNELYTQLAGK